MNLAGLDKLQILDVRKLYKEASLVYKNNSRPANYIPTYIKRRLDFIIETEQIYLIINDLTEIPKCPICGNDCKFINLTSGYSKTCGNKKCCGELLGSRTRGKTYKEIYGDRIIKCGFQKGDRNVAKRFEVREKISESVKASYTPELLNKRRQYLLSREIPISHMKGRKISDKYGKFFRSTLEAEFSNFLHENNIDFEYEVPIKMFNGHKKIVDFVIDKKIFIEISGYAWEGWQKDFNNKMKIFDDSRNKYDSIVYILTYPNNLKLLKSCLLDSKKDLSKEYSESFCKDNEIIYCKKFYTDEEVESINKVKLESLSNINVFFNSIYDTDAILKDLKFFKQILYAKEFYNEDTKII